MKIKNIGIVGLGWLGLPLANHLVDKGYLVEGTATSKIGKSKLSDKVKFHLLGFEGENTRYPFEKLDLLIITVPPSADDYVSSILTVLKNVPKSTTIFFMSSTGVYGDASGEFDETSPTEATRVGIAKILEVEKYLQTQCENSSVIFRLGGLVGPDRNPSRFFVKRGEIPSPKTTINLVHLSDVIGAIDFFIYTEKLEPVVNVVAPFHPEKGDFYQKIATLFDKEIPQVNTEQGYKRIIHAEVLTQRGYLFKYPNLLVKNIYE